MAVTEYELIYGISTLIFIVISVLIGIRILLKYGETKSIVFLSVGFTWIFLTSSWWGSALSFLFALGNKSLPEFSYLFISNFFVPFAILAWLFSYLKFLYEDKIKWMYVIIGAFLVYEVIFLVLILIDTSYIGEILGVAYWKGSIFTIVFQVLALIISTITGLHFGITTRKTEDKIFRIRGLFIIYAFLSFLILGLLDAVVTLNAISLIIIRILLVICGIAYYFGFFFSMERES